MLEYVIAGEKHIMSLFIRKKTSIRVALILNRDDTMCLNITKLLIIPKCGCEECFPYIFSITFIYSVNTYISEGKTCWKFSFIPRFDSRVFFPHFQQCLVRKRIKANRTVGGFVLNCTLLSLSLEPLYRSRLCEVLFFSEISLRPCRHTKFFFRLTIQGNHVVVTC